jgi:hypothetical protein
MRNAKVVCALVGACLALLVACATTRQVQAWKDAAYQGKIKKTMVVGVFPEHLMRNFVEQEFVAQLKGRGVEGLASNRSLSTDTVRDRAAALAAVKEMGVGTVIAVKVLDKRYSDRAYGGGVAYVPTGYGVGWDGIYADSFAEIGLPVYQHSVDVLMIQMNVYDVAEGKLIFSAVSNTYVEGALEKVVPPFVESMVKQLAADTLL